MPETEEECIDVTDDVPREYDKIEILLKLPDVGLV